MVGIIQSQERTMTAAKNELNAEQLATAAGGMKWDRNHVSPNVIDARGGQFHVLFWDVTWDIKGNISSVTPR
jgi:hypothetical protein